MNNQWNHSQVIFEPSSCLTQIFCFPFPVTSNSSNASQIHQVDHPTQNEKRSPPHHEALRIHRPSFKIISFFHLMLSLMLSSPSARLCPMLITSYNHYNHPSVFRPPRAIQFCISLFSVHPCIHETAMMAPMYAPQVQPYDCCRKDCVFEVKRYVQKYSSAMLTTHFLSSTKLRNTYVKAAKR